MIVLKIGLPDLTYTERIYGVIGFGVFIALIILIALIFGIRSIIRGRRYDREELPTLVELGLEDEEQVPTPGTDDDRSSTFTLSEIDDDGGDAASNSLLREANSAAQNISENEDRHNAPRRGIFGRHGKTA